MERIGKLRTRETRYAPFTLYASYARPARALQARWLP